MIFAIKPFEIQDGDGIRTTVFFKGCPLRCRWCHNPESFSAKKDILYDAELCKSCMRCTTLCAANQIRDDQHVFDRTACTHCGKCQDVCPHGALEPIGTEPTQQTLAEELLRDAMFRRCNALGRRAALAGRLLRIACKATKKEGINVAVDTSLYVPQETLDKIIPFVDIFLVDIKAIDEETHIRCTGVSNRQILSNIRHLDALGIPMEIRYPYVPDYNDREAPTIADFVEGLHTVKRIRVLPYHSYAERKYECLGMQYPIPDVPLPTSEEILAARTLLGAEKD